MNSKLIKTLSTIFLILTAGIIAYIIYNIFLSGTINSNSSSSKSTAGVNIKFDSRLSDKVDPDKNPYYKEKILKENAKKKNNPDETFLDIQDKQNEIKNIDAEVINLYSIESNNSSSSSSESSSISDNSDLDSEKMTVEKDINPETVVSRDEIVLESTGSKHVKPENNVTIQLMLLMNDRENMNPAVTVVDKNMITTNQSIKDKRGSSISIKDNSSRIEVSSSDIYVKTDSGEEITITSSGENISNNRKDTEKNSRSQNSTTINIQPGYSTIVKLRTAIDNSGKIPAIADIITGRFKGCVLVGKGEVNSREDALYITFDKLSCRAGSEYSVKAIAFTLAEQSAEFADKVDRHTIDKMFINTVRSGLKIATAAFLIKKSREQKTETSETDKTGTPKTVNVYNSSNFDPSLFKEAIQPLDSELQGLSSRLKTEIMVDRRYMLVMFF